jgi:hypothetical protein
VSNGSQCRGTKAQTSAEGPDSCKRLIACPALRIPQRPKRIHAQTILLYTTLTSSSTQSFKLFFAYSIFLTFADCFFLFASND